MESYIFAGAIVGLALWFAWVALYGLGRGSLATLLRCAWILPLILAFFPETRFENLPRTLAQKPVHLLIDDSKSVTRVPAFNSEIEESKIRLQEECLRLGCIVKESKLSDLSKETQKGYTPLSKVLESWFYQTSGDPWVLISDGGDYRPTEPWSSKYKGLGKDASAKPRGLIVSLKKDDERNIFLEESEGPVFSFADQPVELTVRLRRSSKEATKETVQVQVMAEGKILTTLNTTINQGEDAIDLKIPMNALAKGQHLLTIKALPSAHETALWDNSITQSVEVLANTIGVLHLLGAPSWDGRYLRRYLKAEPKYDLISFFILRDPPDTQLVNERELSLIPFPVDRLFNEELPNFHIVVLQNFALFQFLDPPYQHNLVNFVKNGGGLLFLGGPRALHPGDANNSSLSSILPFQANGIGATPRSFMNQLGSHDKNGPYYDADMGYTFKLASPSREQRDLANIYDDFSALIPSLNKMTKIRGLHHVENVVFPEASHTPLINAVRDDGKESPLVVASYPGKGRALWVFSDGLYNLALAPGEEQAYDIYQKFLSTSFNWLLRQELKKPLVIRRLTIDNTQSGHIHWRMNYLGAAAKYLNEGGGDWNVSVCGQSIASEDYLIEQIGQENWELSGILRAPVAEGIKCAAEIRGSHSAFGSVNAQGATMVPLRLSDDEVAGAPQKLESLAAITGAVLVDQPKQINDSLLGFLDEVTGRFGVSYPSRFRTVQDHFWVLGRWWFFVLMLALPFEVIVRRWPQLTSSKKRIHLDPLNPTRRRF